MAALHDDEVEIDDATLGRLLEAQFPQWAHLPVTPAGHGTDNRMVRLGDELVIRLPRTPGTAADVAKEQTWLPRLARQLPVAIPEPVALGRPGAGYPFPWSVLRWIDGVEVDSGSLTDPVGFGRALAGFVRSLHAVDLMGARRAGPLSHYRGGRLADLAGTTAANLAACRDLDVDLDLDALSAIWDAANRVDAPPVAPTWTHTDLRPANLVARDGVLVGVIDFGGLSVGDPTCEHAAVWDLPADARLAYADELGLDHGTRLRARAWALAIALSGVPYYWSTWPGFVDECLRRLRAVVTDDL